MNAYKITDQKVFTTKLFLEEVFDNFLVSEACFITRFSTEINGRTVNPEEGAEEFTDWGTIRPIAYSLIRGKVLPKSIKIVLKLNRENTLRTLEAAGFSGDKAGVSGLYINIRYEEGTFSLVTGTSFATFTPDRSLEGSWSKFVCRFLTASGISFEEL